MRIGYVVVVVLFAVIAAYVYWYANPSPRLIRLRRDVGRVVDSLASRSPNDPNVRRLVARFDPANIYEPLTTKPLLSVDCASLDMTGHCHTGSHAEVKECQQYPSNKNY